MGMMQFGLKLAGLAARTGAADRAVLAAEFDAPFYTSQFPGGSAPADLMGHYLRVGWHDGLDPTPAFSGADYLARHPDVAASGMNPFLHYLRFGRAEGRKSLPARPHVSSPQRRSNPAPPLSPAQTGEVSDVAGSIDVTHYASAAGIAFASAREAAQHYLSGGAAAGLDPRPDFSTRLYLEIYPDVAQSGVNPFLHYFRHGRQDGRLCHDPAAEIIERIRTLRPLEEVERDWLRPAIAPYLGRADAARKIRQALGQVCRMMLALTHDDFRINQGGIQQCVAREAAEAAGYDTAYVAIWPAQPRPRLAPEGSDPLVMLVANGDEIGPLRPDDLTAILAGLTADGWTSDLVVHSLLGHAPEYLADWLGAIGRADMQVWLHDYLLICPSYTLQRNSVSFCGAPDPASTACAICTFGEERRSHLMRLTRLAQNVRIHAIAPSRAAARMIDRRGTLPLASLCVMEHRHLSRSRPARQSIPPNTPITIAFVGTAAPHKGWRQFRDLARANRGRDGLRFVCFGDTTCPEPGMETVCVKVTTDDPDAMITALRTAQVDLVLHWASWPETFSLSTAEAICAGAYVLTNPASGNVAALVRKTGAGCILPDEAALRDLIAGPDLGPLVARRRRAAARSGFIARSSGLSHELPVGGRR